MLGRRGVGRGSKQGYALERVFGTGLEEEEAAEGVPQNGVCPEGGPDGCASEFAVELVYRLRAAQELLVEMGQAERVVAVVGVH